MAGTIGSNLVLTYNKVGPSARMGALVTLVPHSTKFFTWETSMQPSTHHYALFGGCWHWRNPTCLVSTKPRTRRPRSSKLSPPSTGAMSSAQKSTELVVLPPPPELSHKSHSYTLTSSLKLLNPINKSAQLAISAQLSSNPVVYCAEKKLHIVHLLLDRV